MDKTLRPRALVIDAAPAPLLFEELDAFFDSNIDVTLNLRNVSERDAVRQRYGERLSYADFDGFDRASVLAALTADGIGHEVLKTRVNVPIDRTIIESGVAPALQRRLSVIAQAGVGVDHIDVETATRERVAVTNTPGSNADAVAEFALCQMLVLTRRVLAYNAASQSGVWAKSNAGPVAPQLSELTLGVIGVGNIARRFAEKARLLGMRVIGLGSSRFTSEQAHAVGIERIQTLQALLGEADVVSLHAPLNETTRHMIGMAQLMQMKRGAVLINTARGGLVDELALAKVLSDPDGPLAGAAIDTFAKEKAQFASPLVGVEKALLSPHIAGTTRSAIRAAALQAVENAAAILNGMPSVALVNPDSRLTSGGRSRT